MPALLGRLLTKISLPVCQGRNSGDGRKTIRAKCCSAFAGMLMFVCLGMIITVMVRGMESDGSECTRQNPQNFFPPPTPDSSAMSLVISDISHMREYANQYTRMFDTQAIPDGAQQRSKATRANRLRLTLSASAEVRMGLIAQEMM